jgi:predicted alpha/beta hydrolase
MADVSDTSQLVRESPPDYHAAMNQELQIKCRDGASLAATYFEPARPAGVAAVINGATGVPRGYYETFAGHLADLGIAVLTYDYRGIGGSSGVRGSMEDWGALDQPAALDRLGALRPDDALVVVGHSFGGQVLGLAPNIDRARAALLVAAQHGHWRHWSGARRLRIWLLWWFLIPVLTRVFGHFPGQYFGTARLPSAVARNWARWGRSPHYVSDGSGNPLRPFNDKVSMPIRWLSFDDDPIAPFDAVEALRQYYPRAQVERRHIVPKDWGLDAVGHFGFFRKSLPRPVWNDLARWLIGAVTDPAGDRGRSPN